GEPTSSFVNLSLQRFGLSGLDQPKAEGLRQQVVQACGKLALSFEANVGQTDPRVRFLARGRGYTLFLTSGAEVVLASGKGQPQGVRMQLAGANPAPEVQGLEQQAAKSYYFLGNDPAR